MPKFVLHWAIRATGFTGHGSPLELKTVQRLLDYYIHHPSNKWIQYWIEPYENGII
jgi:hypothetical protein